MLSVAASGLNYIFQILMGNLLTVGEFGTINSLISVSSNIGIAFSPLAILLCNYAVEYASGKDRFRLPSVLLEVLLFTLLVGFGAVLICNSLPGLFQGSLTDQSTVLWSLVLISTVLSSLFCSVLGAFQGLQNFLLYGGFSVAQNLIKIPLAIIGTFAQNPIWGVLVAILITNLLCVILQLILLYHKKIFMINRSVFHHFVPLRDFARGYGNTFLVQLCISFFVNGGDIILVKYAFSEETAGLFTPSLLLGKISLYIVSILAVLILPKANLLYKEGRDSRGLMLQVVGLSFLSASILCTGMYLLGPHFIEILFGSKYQSAYTLFGPICLYVVPMTLNYVLSYYLMAIQYTKIYVISIGTIIIAGVFATVIFLQNIQTMLYMFAILLWIVFFLNISTAFYYVKRNLH